MSRPLLNLQPCSQKGCPHVAGPSVAVTSLRPAHPCVSPPGPQHPEKCGRQAPPHLGLSRPFSHPGLFSRHQGHPSSEQTDTQAPPEDTTPSNRDRTEQREIKARHFGSFRGQLHSHTGRGAIAPSIGHPEGETPTLPSPHNAPVRTGCWNTLGT